MRTVTPDGKEDVPLEEFERALRDVGDGVEYVRGLLDERISEYSKTGLLEHSPADSRAQEKMEQLLYDIQLLKSSVKPRLEVVEEDVNYLLDLVSSIVKFFESASEDDIKKLREDQYVGRLLITIISKLRGEVASTLGDLKRFESNTSS